MGKRGSITLITGGARSGKSAYALSLAEPFARRAYLATAQPLDDEMAGRISRHRQERGPLWHTAEVPLDIAQWLDAHEAAFDIIVLDCLTLWLSNVMLKGLDAQAQSDALIASMRGSQADLIVVTNEVGMGIVPDNPLGRGFRDAAGRLNRSVAEAADEVLLVVAGQSLKIKSKNGGQHDA